MSDELNILSELDTNGYTVLKSIANPQEFCSNHLINKSLKEALRCDSFYYSLLNNSSEINCIFSSIITHQFQQLLSYKFPNSRFTAGSFMVKPAFDYSELNLHQDWSFTDEKNYTPITAWVPIIDTNEKSGGMFFLKGSHKFLNYLRSDSYKTPYFSLLEIGRENVESVIVNKGDVLLFNPATWHGSFPNVSQEARGVFSCIILPEKAPFYYYHKHTPEIALRYTVPDNVMEVFLNEIRKGKDPSELFVKGDYFPYRDSQSTYQELIAKYKHQDKNDKCWNQIKTVVIKWLHPFSVVKNLI
jgi:ectoine hydroxylase-related dioxygenase (phytanoyl-CoA dioxygenase family)